MPSRSILAASQSSYQQTPATVQRPISKRSRAVESMVMWQPAGRGTRLPVKAAVAPRAPEEPSSRQAEPTPAATPSRVEAMRNKIKAGGHASPYRLRKQLPEPVFGQIKQARGFRQFLLRGFQKVRAEWAIVCTAHNLLKLLQRRSLSEALSIAA